MTCACRACRDDREAAADWLAQAAALRLEADELEARAARTLDRVESYSARPLVHWFRQVEQTYGQRRYLCGARSDRETHLSTNMHDVTCEACRHAVKEQP